MKATGIVRNIDELGRIVVPKEIRNRLGIAKNDPVDIFVDGDSIILKKYAPLCHFCGSADSVVEYKEKMICRACALEIANLSN